MTSRQQILFASSLAIATSIFLSPSAVDAQGSEQRSILSQTNGNFDKFAPKPSGGTTKIDYTIWNEALRYFVLPMGQSIRESAPSVEPTLGTRRVYGHDSRYRLEGNRVLFSYLKDDVITSLTEYREDLERTAEQIDISSLSRNEQLAFWTNLHNVAVIEQIALAYPVRQPSRLKLGEADLPLDEAPIITIGHMRMSPKDIRTKIVYPNWNNPKVIYGFFRGDIGGPSIQREAFNANNINELLNISASEFVNSLRGTQKNGSTLEISKIYDEAKPYYFTNWSTDIRAHLNAYSEDEVKDLISRTQNVAAKIYEYDISDLANGEVGPNYNLVESTSEDGLRPRSTRVPMSIQRLLRERSIKRYKMQRRGLLTPRVQIVDLGTTEPEESEVE